MVDEAKIEKAVRLLLEGMGEDVEREGLKDTPRRVARMYSETLAGMDENGNFILNDPNNLENCSRTWPWEDLSSEIQAAWSYTYNG